VSIFLHVRDTFRFEAPRTCEANTEEVAIFRTSAYTDSGTPLPTRGAYLEG